MFDAKRPYNDLPLLAPGASCETQAILNKCIGASRAALAELRLAGQLIPDQAVLINTIPLLEAQGQLGDREHRHHQRCAVPRGEPWRRRQASPAAKEAAALSRGALPAASNHLKTRPLSDAHRRRGLPDRSRAWISTSARRPARRCSNSLTGEVIYTPPEGESASARAARQLGAIRQRQPTTWIRSSAWRCCTTSSRRSIPSRTAMAAPGRILNILCLIQAGLLDHADALSQPPHPRAPRGDYYACSGA